VSAATDDDDSFIGARGLLYQCADAKVSLPPGGCCVGTDETVTGSDGVG